MNDGKDFSAVLVQKPNQNTLLVHDPNLVEALIKHIPENLDRDNSKDFLGITSFGESNFLSNLTTEEEFKEKRKDYV